MLLRIVCLALASLFPPVISAPAATAGTAVNLRIEGATRTIFEGSIFTRGHNVTTVSGGTHVCDGTNAGANPVAGPTCTSALDTAAKLNGFKFDGTFSPAFDDFFITSIGGDTETSTEFWGILLNFQFTPVGGCQQEVKHDDEILFAFNAFNKVHFLKLDGPKQVNLGKKITLTVTDGMTGKPVEGATVHGEVSDANGKVEIKFAELGFHDVKAEKADSIRSNAFEVDVV